MTAKQAISDSVFRLKLYAGALFAGAWSGGVFYVIYLSDGAADDIPKFIQFVGMIWPSFQTEILISTAAGAALFWWLAWMILAKPWRDSSAPPPAAARVRTPWDK